MKYALNRRNFLKSTALATGAVAFGFPAFVRGQNLNSKLNIATIGAGGKGASDTNSCASENIFALCDIDQSHCSGQLKKYPDAKFYNDYRKMFDEVGKSIDAVNIATPDHTHAIIAAAAMHLGKPVYCQKPLTQTIYEARQLLELADRKKIITQMGNQGSASDGLRRAIEVIQSGLLGNIKELHVWSNRPIWPQGMDRPEGSDPIPEGLDWEVWIGPAPMRPFKQGIYHPFNWRGWQDFGTGALGDMACHTVNMPFRALQLGYPTEIEAEAFGGMNQESYPLGSKIRFQFPKRGDAPYQQPVTLWWYDGGHPKAEGAPQAANGKRKKRSLLHDGNNKPPRELLAAVEASRGEIPGSGCLIIGEKGQHFSGDAYGSESLLKLDGDKKFLSSQKHPAAASIPQSVPRNTIKGGTDVQHHVEWINAIKENKPELCFSRFEIGAKLTEIMLLGCVALRVGKKIEWDGPNMRATNAPEAARFIKRENRAGWTMGV
jgi:hypothetical protein